MSVLSLCACFAQQDRVAQMVFINDIFTKENCKVCRVQYRNYSKKKLFLQTHTQAYMYL